MVSSKQKFLYPKIDITVFSRSPATISPSWKNVQPLTAEVAKEILGWVEESEPNEFKQTYLFKDANGRKIRCLNNLANRPFKYNLSQKWKSEILRGKWEQNGETIVIDKEGFLHDGQHRLIGLVLASQELAKMSPELLPECWKKQEVSIDAIVVTGIEGKDKTVNTIGTGTPRTIEDVFYRSHFLQSIKPASKRLKVSKLLKNAVKYVWSYTGEDKHSKALYKPHSEILDFLENHKTLIECATFLVDEIEGHDYFSKMVSLPLATALLYLFAASESSLEEYQEERTEKTVNFENRDSAESYFVDLINRGSKTENIVESILDIPLEYVGTLKTYFTTHYLIAGWNSFKCSSVKIPLSLLKMPEKENELGQKDFLSEEKIGGIATF